MTLEYKGITNNIMSKELLLAGLRRFLRVFIGGFLAYLVTVFPTISVGEWKDIGLYLPGIVWAGIGAGLVAIDKMYRGAP